MYKIENINRISVIGAGILGHSIALKFATEGYRVNLCDNSKHNLMLAKENITSSLLDLIKNGFIKSTIISIMEKIEFHTVLSEAVNQADLVIEAVTEDLTLKCNVLASIEKEVNDNAIIASNSSSLLPSEYNLNLRNKRRVVGTHFFNPPHLLPLVEVIKAKDTDDQVIDCLMNLFVSMRMQPVTVHKETPGFIGNRLQFALLREAIKLVSEGVSSAEDIDKVVKYGFGRRLALMGPFEVFDFGGWDTINRIYETITNEQSPDIIKEKVKKGEIGVKSGSGFYDWDQNKLTEKKMMINDIYTYIEKTLTSK